MPNSLEEFKRDVLQNPALREQFKTVANSQEFVNLAVQLGQELGYSFTVAEVEAALAQSRTELSDEQLEAVAGGGEIGGFGQAANTDYPC